MSLFVLLLQIHRVRRKEQFDLSNTKIRAKFIGPQTLKRSTCAKLDFFSHLRILFNSKMRIRRRLSNLQVLRLTMEEMLWVARDVSVSKLQTVADYVFLSRSIQIESIKKKV